MCPGRTGCSDGRKDEYEGTAALVGVLTIISVQGRPKLVFKMPSVSFPRGYGEFKSFGLKIDSPETARVFDGIHGSLVNHLVTNRAIFFPTLKRVDDVNSAVIIGAKVKPLVRRKDKDTADNCRLDEYVMEPWMVGLDGVDKEEEEKGQPGMVYIRLQYNQFTAAGDPNLPAMLGGSLMQPTAIKELLTNRLFTADAVISVTHVAVLPNDIFSIMLRLTALDNIVIPDVPVQT